MIKLKLKPEPIWFGADDPLFNDSEFAIYTKEERAKVKFLIYPFLPSLIEEVRKENTKTINRTTFVDGRRTSVPVSETDEKKANTDMLDQIVLDWKGMKDGDGQDIPCNLENKQLVADSFAGIGAAWIEASRWVMARLSKDQQEKGEKDTKNSKPSQVGAGKEERK